MATEGELLACAMLQVPRTIGEGPTIPPTCHRPPPHANAPPPHPQRRIMAPYVNGPPFGKEQSWPTPLARGEDGTGNHFNSFIHLCLCDLGLEEPRALCYWVLLKCCARVSIWMKRRGLVTTLPNPHRSFMHVAIATGIAMAMGMGMGTGLGIDCSSPVPVCTSVQVLLTTLSPART